MQGSGTTTADDPGGLIEVGGVLIRAVVSDEAMEKAFRVDKTNQAPKRVMRRPVLTNKEACDRRNLERAMLENLRKQLGEDDGA